MRTWQHHRGACAFARPLAQSRTFLNTAVSRQRLQLRQDRRFHARKRVAPLELERRLAAVERALDQVKSEIRRGTFLNLSCDSIGLLTRP
jgi:hypothetical protein